LPQKVTYRVLRGGSWNNNSNNLRASNRNNNTPDNINNNIGFRVASTQVEFWSVRHRRARTSLRGPFCEDHASSRRE